MSLFEQERTANVRALTIADKQIEGFVREKAERLANQAGGWHFLAYSRPLKFTSNPDPLALRPYARLEIFVPRCGDALGRQVAIEDQLREQIEAFNAGS